MNLWKIFSSAKKGVATLSFVLCALISTSIKANVALLDRVVAIVNDDIVLLSELNQRTASVYSSIKNSGTQAPAEEILKKQVLERLISERLQLNMGINAGVRISDQEIDQTVSRLAASNQARPPRHSR